MIKLAVIAAVSAPTSKAGAVGQMLGADVFTSAFVAAVVAAVVALIGHLISRQNARLAGEIARENARLSASLEAAKKLADSRQNWIDELRQDMSEFVSLAVIRKRSRDTGSPIKDNDFERLMMVSSRISMRMNPLDADYEALEKSMANCMLPSDASASGEHSRAFVVISQRILKREWDVLKTALLKLNKTSVEQ